MTRSKKRILAAFLVAGLFVVGSGLAFEWWFAGACYWQLWPSEAFTSAGWLRSPELERYRYVRDLIGSNQLLGRSKEEVIALLGDPGYTAPDGSYMYYTVWDFDDSLCGMNSNASLQLNFNSTGAIVSQSIVFD